MKKIYKYEIKHQSHGKFTLTLPRFADFLHAAVDNKTSVPCMWFEFDVEDEQHTQEVNFYLMPTGVDFDDKKLLYLTTFQEGPFVWHLYQEFA